jgi:hypothetical protein
MASKVTTKVFVWLPAKVWIQSSLYLADLGRVGLYTFAGLSPIGLPTIHHVGGSVPTDRGVRGLISTAPTDPDLAKLGDDLPHGFVTASGVILMELLSLDDM